MSTRQIRFEYDAEVDAAHLTIDGGKVRESDEAESGIVVDFDARHRVVGVEILRFAKRFSAMTRSVRAARSGNGHKKITASNKN
jgi:uncharacterized protein YuzE